MRQATAKLSLRGTFVNMSFLMTTHGSSWSGASYSLRRDDPRRDLAKVEIWEFLTYKVSFF